MLTVAAVVAGVLVLGVATWVAQRRVRRQDS
jgi:cytochrome c oxidase assembly factor CtaG